ncbi:threonine ammonia-lyase [Nocardiopsis valliformis]|uniref:threonine ammonia-lyase n=1 Tax=Nocardiopsis valliformis TaxID=239974 RepID=UPI000349763C|nr:PLP-dependent lyase/thiolase [Nocardiopsis valliformis]
MHTLDLDLERIARAAQVIDPVFLNSPQYVDEQLCAALGRRVLVKVETLNPLRSFKGRGVDLLARELAPGTRMVCTSTGNFGQAVGYAATRRGLKAEVFVPAGISQVKLTRMRSLGARVHEIQGPDVDGAARAFAAAHPEAVLVEDGQDARIAEGAGTIGVDLLKAGPIDAVVLPVGDGALITGVGRWLKEHSPATHIVGVCAQGAPSMATSWRLGRPVGTEGAHTFAEGIAISDPIPASVARMRVLVDQMVEVCDAQILQAMRTALVTLGVVPEPAGAAGLATLITGANVDQGLLPRLVSAP